MPEKIGIIGLGLIGGSLSKAFDEAGFKIYGYDKSLDSISSAVDFGRFEGLTDDMDEFLGFEPDLIYIAVPVKAGIEILHELGRKNIKTLITDACSTKMTVCSEARKLGLNFCGGHPIAGKEVSGFANSEAELLKGALHILTDGDEANMSVLKKLHEKIGMNVKVMNAEYHDEIFGVVSHFPHLISFALMELILKKDKNLLEYTGGGFKDFTRIAASDPVMWSDIFVDNSEHINDVIDEYISVLNDWKRQINKKEKSILMKKIRYVSSARQCLYENI